MRTCLFLILIIYISIGCLADDQSTSPPEQIHIIKAYPKLKFNRPVDFQSPADGTNRIFVVEQSGRIFVFPNDYQAGEKIMFLDITENVNDSGNEEGLLGLAFHPDYQTNGYFYVNYTAVNPGRTIIARYTVDKSDQNKALPLSGKIILEYEQPFGNHNGGQILFGPDGYLYIGVGDGGAAGDPYGNGQNKKTLLGSILRIDVNQSDQDQNYTIPRDNPFAGNRVGNREEIFAYGLRNPWRFTFHPVSGDLWAGDVGQNRLEEIDIIKKGKNYGWNIMEGTECYRRSNDCDTTGLTAPILEYNHDVGQSITGGCFYTGDKPDFLKDAYLYADYVSGKIWSIKYVNGKVTDHWLLKDSRLNISSFGKDNSGRLYFCAFDGYIYKIEER